MALPNISKARSFWAKTITCWIPVKTWRKALRGIILMGIGNYIRVLRNDKKTTFPHELTIAAIMKNEGPYLKEWLDFHILVGVEKFYLYDNESTDNTRDVLAPYIARGIVEYTYFPGTKQQTPAYIDALNRFANDTRWMAVIDLDEFIVPVHTKTITELLYTLPRNFGALVITWMMYGSSGHVHAPGGLVIENYKYRANSTRKSGCKSIVNPRLVVSWHNPHINAVAGFLVDENGRHLGRIDQTYNPPSHDKIRCNHYVTKSFDEFRTRCAKGSAGGNTAKKAWTREKFDALDTNDIYDNIMDKYVSQLKEQ